MTHLEPDDPIIEPARHPWWKIRVPLGPLALAYILIIAMGAAGLGLIQGQQHRFERQVVDDAHARCEDSRDGRQVLRDLVELTDAGGGALHLTQIPGFQDLDPAAQQYFRNLEAASSPPTTTPGQKPEPSAFVKRALALLPLPDCEGTSP